MLTAFDVHLYTMACRPFRPGRKSSPCHHTTAERHDGRHRSTVRTAPRSSLRGIGFERLVEPPTDAGMVPCVPLAHDELESSGVALRATADPVRFSGSMRVVVTGSRLRRSLSRVTPRRYACGRTLIARIRVMDVDLSPASLAR